MTRQALSQSMVVVENRVRDIQSSWTPSQREHRAKMGEQRRRELCSLLMLATDDSEYAAVGAATCEDWRRIAG